MTSEEGPFPAIRSGVRCLTRCGTEWEFIQGLEYRAQTGDDADFVKMMYTVRLKKVSPSHSTF